MTRSGELFGVLVVSLLGACGGSGTDSARVVGSPVGDVPVVDSARGNAGDELRDGFVVAEGTTLIGPVMPKGDDVWQAILFVDGDPSEVMEAYLSQAEAIGMTPKDTTAEVEHGLREGIPEDQQQSAMCVRNPTGGQYACAAVAERSGGGDDSACVSLMILRGPVEGRFNSHLWIRHSKPLPDFGCVADPYAIGDPDGAVPELPNHWPSLPTTGDALGESAGMLRDLHVVEGSHLAAPPLDHPDPYSYGRLPYAILEVTGHPVSVLDAYLAEFEEALVVAEPAPPPTTTQIDEHTTLYEASRTKGPDDDAFFAEMVVDDDGQDWLIIWGGDEA